MFGLIFISSLIIYVVFILPLFANKMADNASKEEPIQAKKLWSIAQESMKKQHSARAEKALLALLNFDEKNAAAYNRLGILYTKKQKYDEATKCFEIAQSLDKNPALFHNTGLIYLEIGEYEKAVMAFRQALEMEGDLPARFIALAKAEEKLGHINEALDALESAFELDHSVSTLRQILALYEITDDAANIAATTARIEEQIIKNAEARDKKLASVSERFSEFKKGITNKSNHTPKFSPRNNISATSANPPSAKNTARRTITRIAPARKSNPRRKIIQ